MNFAEEMIVAGRGVIALLLGRRDAPSYFDLSLKGLTGSLAALLVAVALGSYLPLAPDGADAGIHPWQNLLLVGLVYALQAGAGAIVLNQINRLDGLVPYLVADNWASFFVTIIALGLGLFGLDGFSGWALLAIPAFIVEINTSRLIVTLTPLQIGMFIIAQLVAGFIGLMMMALIFPAPALVQ